MILCSTYCGRSFLSGFSCTFRSTRVAAFFPRLSVTIPIIVPSLQNTSFLIPSLSSCNLYYHSHHGHFPSLSSRRSSRAEHWLRCCSSPSSVSTRASRGLRHFLTSLHFHDSTETHERNNATLHITTPLARAAGPVSILGTVFVLLFTIFDFCVGTCYPCCYRGAGEGEGSALYAHRLADL